MKLSDFQVREFYNYKIRFIVEDSTEMFFVTDLVNQYNKINNTNKKLYKYFENSSTKELLDVWRKNKKSPNSDGLDFSSNIKDIPGVIKFIKIDDSYIGSTMHCYLMCEEMMNSLLLWLDQDFAVKIFIFLRKCRAADSQFLNHPDEFIKSRIVPVEESQDWSFMIIPIFKSNEVVLKASYCRTKNITKTQFMNSNTIMIHGLPNGFSFKYFVYTELIQVVKSYSGHSNGCHRSSYSISRHVYDNQYKFLMLDITHAINKTRLMLNWGLDYESEVCTQVLDKLKSLEIPFCTNINMSKDSLELIQKLFSSELIH